MAVVYRRLFQLSQKFAKTLNANTPSRESTLFNVNCDNLPKRWAGHSKWQNIKSTKEAADRNKSLKTGRICQQILLCVQQHGPDPALNSSLKSLLDEAAKMNVPKSTTDNVIAKALTQNMKPFWTVFSGPKGFLLGVEVIFPNNKSGYLSTKLSPFTKKLKLKLENHYSHLCSEKGLIIVKPLDVENAYEKALEDAIEMGVDEVHEDGDDEKSLIFECSPDRVQSYADQISKKGYKIISASTELGFDNFVPLNSDEKQAVEKLITTLQSTYEEVLRITHNAEM